jgi:hypothetical protein
MGLRFRRSWGVLPGIRLNLGLRSGSVSFGVRGLHYTVGTRGSRVTVGLPGTGLYWTQKLNSPIAGRSAQGTGNALPAGAQTQAIRQPLNQPAQRTAVHSLAAPQHLIQPTLHSAVSTAQSARAHTHVFVPAWLAWSVLTVVVIGALCFSAAAIGAMLR